MTTSDLPDAAVVAVSARYRREFADLVSSLDAAQLAAPSLCAGWDVRTVAGHLVSALTTTVPSFLVQVLRARGNVDRAVDRAARRDAARPVEELVAVLRDRADSSFAPPGIGARGPMTDAIVHTADVTVPLGLPFDPDPVDVRIALDFVVGTVPLAFTTRRRLAGLRFVADDAGFARGEGAEVRGHGVDVLLAACGRPAVLDRLTGDGVATLAARLTGR
ncbi:maleylpyruvate isomerase family mycothiol-dependent enzyme [Pseudonocardia sp. McavD-2-B]|uniref:maleylpyruvate isomerase family mycothiol-dependent enzyme n=1 Tax=Pseudonocardia sp. McavD-2-B TaxID=2954499 RepID=UPI00209786BD|nr:maleylpyruvate isomerase family mycothiol-dependent enzyme [Pseudonocardia sp. McavD-2-B]MCO7195003.1 maleylpyruvate isomerase family mycothiol-dependent enzyme [Pseudonocardia sp. McavD-2-B]